jgi:hypothetical protein
MGADSPSPTLCSPPHRIRSKGPTPKSCLRRFCCALCGSYVNVCALCDRNRRYCSASCRDTARSKDVRMAGVIYQRSVQGRAKHAARQRAYWARQRVKQLDTLSVPGVSANARLRRHTLDSRIASPQASIPIAAYLSKRETRAQCSQDGPTESLRTGSTPLLQPEREPCCFVCARPSGFWLMVYPRYARPKAHRTGAP